VLPPPPWSPDAGTQPLNVTAGLKHTIKMLPPLSSPPPPAESNAWMASGWGAISTTAPLLEHQDAEPPAVQEAESEVVTLKRSRGRRILVRSMVARAPRAARTVGLGAIVGVGLAMLAILVRGAVVPWTPQGAAAVPPPVPSATAAADRAPDETPGAATADAPASAAPREAESVSSAPSAVPAPTATPAPKTTPKQVLPWKSAPRKRFLDALRALETPKARSPVEDRK
jgi:hypothetical protein